MSSFRADINDVILNSCLQKITKKLTLTNTTNPHKSSWVSNVLGGIVGKWMCLSFVYLTVMEKKQTEFNSLKCSFP